MDFDGRPEQVDAYRQFDAQWAAVLAGGIPAGILSEEEITHE